LQTMKNFFLNASGVAVGTLLYTGFLSSTDELDWGRAAFVGIFCGICFAIWPGKNRKK
jgi:hypothetical protein